MEGEPAGAQADYISMLFKMLRILKLIETVDTYWSNITGQKQWRRGNVWYFFVGAFITDTW